MATPSLSAGDDSAAATAAANSGGGYERAGGPNRLSVAPRSGKPRGSVKRLSVLRSHEERVRELQEREEEQREGHNRERLENHKSGVNFDLQRRNTHKASEHAANRQQWLELVEAGAPRAVWDWYLVRKQ